MFIQYLFRNASLGNQNSLTITSFDQWWNHVREPIPEPPAMHQQEQSDWPPDEEGDWFVFEVRP